MSANNNDDGDQSNPSTPDTVPAQTPAYDFQWDANKALANLLKHGVSFESAATVLNDPMLLTVYDAQHSQFEERWFSVGYEANQSLLAVSHTFQPTSTINITVRIISARPATRDERRQYEETPR
jgi:uncharacterized protein